MKLKVSYSPRLVFFLIILLSTFFCQKMVGQSAPAGPCDCAYPIIFVHGFGGNGTSFVSIYDNSSFQAIWEGYDEFNVVLNATTGTDIFGDSNEDNPNFGGAGTYQNDDVIIQFVNETNELSDVCAYAVNFDNYWDENPLSPTIIPNSGGNPGSLLNPHSESNQSSTFKQGYALGKIIKRVIEKTGKNKVVLVGHSMGGLACREYLQRTWTNPNTSNIEKRWWVDPTENDGHKVAKLLTVGTPHRGSNFSLSSIINIPGGGALGFNVQSEAARDLRFKYTYTPLSSKPGVYLYGGNELIGQVTTGDLVYFNDDVNCNGVETDNITGINVDGTSSAGGNLNRAWDGTFDNPLMPLPQNVKYTFYVGNFYGSALCSQNVGDYGCKGDVVVDDERQWLYSGGDGKTYSYLIRESVPMPNDGQNHRLSDRITSLNRKNHLNETGDINHIIRGIDEGDYPFFAYDIDISDENTPNDDGWYSGIAQVRADKVPLGSLPSNFIILDDLQMSKIDCDWFKFSISEPSPSIQLQFQKQEGTEAYVDFYTNIPDPYSNQNGKQYFNSLYGIPPNIDLSEKGSLFLIVNSANNGLVNINLTNGGCFEPGEYYVRFTHIITDLNIYEAWKRPYKFKLQKADLEPECGNNVCESIMCGNVNIVENCETCPDDCSICGCELFLNNAITYDCTDLDSILLSIDFLGIGDSYAINVDEINYISGITAGNYRIGSFMNGDDLSIEIIDSSNFDCVLNIELNIACGTNNPNATGGGENKILTYEYWFDTNIENKIKINTPASESFDLISNVPTDGLTPGLHTVNFRFKDKGEKYSSVVSKIFEKKNPVFGNEKVIVAYQVWFDDDYTNIVHVNSSSFSDVFELLDTLNTSELSNGLHSINVRFIDNSLAWSSVTSHFFEKIPISPTERRELIAYEYWFDENYDEKIFMDINPNSEHILIENIPAAQLSPGLHIINIRYLDNSNQWSSALSRFFHKIGIENGAPNLVVAYRYWFDLDLNNGELINLANPINPLDLTTEIDASNLSMGDHTFNIQFLDSLGLWSSVITDTFSVGEIISANFTSDKNMLCEAGEIVFTNNSINGLNYEWNFGDGQISNEENPSHIYSQFGSYDVTLIAMNPTLGISDTLTFFDFIKIIDFEMNVSNDNSICEGDSTELTATGGIEYLWSPDISLDSNSGSSVFAFPNSNTEYQVIGTDLNGCKDTAAIAVDVLQMPVVEVQGATEICTGDTTIIVLSGADEYQWSPTLGIIDQNGDSFYLSPDSSQSYTIIGINGCGEGQNDFTLAVLNSITTNVDAEICEGEFYQIGANVYNSTGIYQEVLTASGGCDSIVNLDLTVKGSPIIQNAFIVDAICGNNVGSITLTVGGASPPFNYLWSNGSTTFNPGGLSGGVYSVSVTNTLNCTIDSTFTVDATDALEVLFDVQGISCFGAEDGQVIVEITGGSPNYTYDWSPGPSNSDLSNVGPGLFNLNIFDCCGCSLDTFITLIEPPLLISNLMVIEPTDLVEGAASVNPQGGIPPYQILWSNGETSDTISNLQEGNYNVLITDTNGCESFEEFLIILDAKEKIGLSEINIYPNPTLNLLYITGEFLSKQTGEIRIYNVLGQVVSILSIENSLTFEKTIDFSESPAGTYFVSIITDDGIYGEKVIVLD